jgi:Protein of unknown function (DUF2635)
MFVKPGPNPRKPGSLLKVRFLRTKQLLPDAGAEVPRDGFWLRRLRDGDVVLASPTQPAAAVEAVTPAVAQVEER